MTDNIISISDLLFGYDPNTPVLKSLNLSVPKGAIYGFLGANGTGKTTTIRTILGLLKPQAGSIDVFGQSIQKNRIGILKNIGSLIEEPSLYSQLSGFDNLKIACQYLNASYKKIDEVLELVNLKGQGKKATKQYSTGMKQRLGLAIALLRNPDLLILDEPTNGLDPNGIIEVRTIIQNLHQQGKTILLSSHLLTEIEKIASHVGIIQNGQMLFEGSLDKLNQLKSSHLKVNIKTENAKKAIDILNTNYDISRIDDHIIEIDLSNEEQVPDIISTLAEHKIRLYEVTLQKTDLEELFINLTK